MQTQSPKPLTMHTAAFVSVMMAIAIPLRASGVVTQQVALGLAIVTGLYLLFAHPPVRQVFREAVTSKIAKVAWFIPLAWGLSTAYSINPLGSLQIGARSVLLVLGVVVIWAVVKLAEEHHARAQKVMLAANGIINVLVLLSLLGVPYILSIMRARFAHEDPEFSFKAYAAVAMCLIPVSIWCGRRLGGGWKRLGYGLPATALAIVLLTENRASLAGILAMLALIIVTLIVKRHRYAKELVIAVGVSGAAILAWLYHQRYPLTGTIAELPYFPAWLIDPHRQNIWHFVIEKVQESPWLGYGIDQLNYLPGAGQTVSGLGTTAHFVPSHPHNWLLEMLGETGVIGTLPVLITLGALAWSRWRIYTQRGDEFALAQLGLLAGFCCSALFNFSMWAVWWQLVLFTLFAFISATRPTNSAP